jgi:hypothetical protein
MERIVNQLRDLAEQHNVPVFCAGDIFNSYAAIPELINWAVDNLPHMYAIPGQHDMPQHAMSEMHRSAFATLCRAKTITQLSPTKPLHLKNFMFTGHAYGTPVARAYKAPPGAKGAYRVAIAHEYNWIAGCGHGGATPAAKITKRRKALTAFHIVAFGDNHHGFEYQLGNTTIWNCGTLMRRLAVEADYKPRLGLLLSDGSIAPHYLDTSKDRFDKLAAPDSLDTSVDVGEFLSTLGNLTHNPLDYCGAIRRYLDTTDVHDGVRRVLLEAIENAA